MKKSLKSLIAISASVLTTGAFAASNMENPLYLPKNREVYLKTGASVMYKKADHTKALKARNLDGTEEFPIWRFTEDLGYGITDRLAVIGRFGYTHDDDIDRKGMHRGRVGLMYRALEESDPIVLDLYSEMYLSGVSPMKGTYTNNGFKFDNYSNGRYGLIVGTRFGKTFGKLTLAAHIEYLQTFGNHNNKIAIAPDVTPLDGQLKPGDDLYALRGAIYPLTMSQLGFPKEIAVELKSTHETCFGFDTMYQIDSKWSFGAGFEYYEHHDNGVRSIHTKLKQPSGAKVALDPYNTALETKGANSSIVAQALQYNVKDGLLKKTANMRDGWDEYVVKANIANQITDSIQVALFAEYTFDNSHSGSQNGTDIKAEAGVRFNARF